MAQHSLVSERPDQGLERALLVGGGRGLAELRLGKAALGQADLAAAKKLDGGVAKQFSDMGLTP